MNACFEEMLQHRRSLLDGALRAMTARNCTKRTITPSCRPARRAETRHIARARLMHPCDGLEERIGGQLRTFISRCNSFQRDELALKERVQLGAIQLELIWGVLEEQ